MKKQEANLKKALQSLWAEPTADVYPKKYSTGGQILSTMASLIPGYGAVISPLISIADQYRDKTIADKKAKQDMLNSRPVQMNTDIYGQMASGGYTTSKFKQYRTGGHASGNDQLISENGVPSNNNAVASVQNNENAYTNNKQTYIYSDVLVNPETGNTFNVDSAKAVKKYKYADTDPEQKRALDFTMNRLSMLNDTMRNMKDSVQKAFGGPPDPGKSLIPTAKISQESIYYPINIFEKPRDTTDRLISTMPLGIDPNGLPYPSMDADPRSSLPKTKSIDEVIAIAASGTTNVGGWDGSGSKFKSKERFREKAGGGLTSEDRGSDKKPYPSVASNNFAGGNRSYPIPTKADAIDALRLAGLHGRSDVRANVYEKYPELKKAYGGNPLSKMTNMATTSVADALAFQGQHNPDTPLQEALDKADLYYHSTDFNLFSNGERGWQIPPGISTFPLIQPWSNVITYGSDNNQYKYQPPATPSATQPATPVANVTTPTVAPTTSTKTPVLSKSAMPKYDEISPEDALNVDLTKELGYATVLDNPVSDRSITMDERAGMVTNPYKNDNAKVNTPYTAPPDKKNPFNYNAVAMGLKAVALGKSVADALEKPVVEKPMFTDYNASDRQMYGTNVDYTQARQDAMAASNLAANVNRAASSGFNQYQGRMQSTYGNLADQLGQISMNENLQRNQQAMQRGQYETAKAIDVKNTMYQNRIDNMQNMANAKLADQKLFSELSQIGTEFNQYQGYKEMLQNNKELSQATINQGLALIGSNYANFGFTKDFIDKIKSGQATQNELIQFIATTDKVKQNQSG